MPEWIGKTIGKVRIEKYLARGGMAEVYLGTHLTLERPVAVKVLHGYIEEDPGLLERFQREARVVAGLRHSNIVQIFDFDALDGHPYIVMEYLSGPTLAVYLRSLHERNELIPPHQIARLLKGLTSALDYAHGLGIIHRDIKPGNIMLHSKTGQVLLDAPLTKDIEAVITDFGLVRISSAATQTASGMISGTPAYMAPEQARGDKTDHRTDIYSLGVVLYELLAGRVPFDGDSTFSIMYQHINEPPPPIAGISHAVQAVIDKALVKDPDARYQSSLDMAVDFYLAIGMTAEAETVYEKPSKIPEPTIIYPDKQKPAQTQSRVSPTWIGVGIASVLCILVLVFGAVKFLGTLNASKATEAPGAVQSPGAVPATKNSLPSDPADLPDGTNMVEVKTDTYEVGTATIEDEWHVAPQSISLENFWIDKYQVTNKQYQQYVSSTGAQAPTISGKDNQPVRGVTWDQASGYCTWVKKRLPDEAEWEAAGRGPGQTPQLYPWGNDYDNNGNTSKLPDADPYEVGTYPFNLSPFGVYDMVGNVWEWVGTPYKDIKEGSRILRGGRFGLPQDLAYRLVVSLDDAHYIDLAGFRCASSQVK